eukprot:comp20876_c0_seq1/m.27703 comp20876_c0_seq1/g.27703  ORF comp20876_c0_seq1/g.27703 comp20876_c0_seq1/m.27703 type:complete len:519 (-) comp20876_c0_seq1:568-2124(-)
MSVFGFSTQAARCLHRPTANFCALTVASRPLMAFVVMRRYSTPPETPEQRPERRRGGKKERTWWRNTEHLCNYDREAFKRRSAQDKVAMVSGVLQSLLDQGQVAAAVQILSAYGPCGLTPSTEDKQALQAACLLADREDLAHYLQNIYPLEYQKWEQLSQALSSPKASSPLPPTPVAATTSQLAGEPMTFYAVPPSQPPPLHLTTTTPTSPTPQEPQETISEQTQTERKKQRTEKEDEDGVSSTFPSSSSESSGEEGSGSGEETSDDEGESPQKEENVSVGEKECGKGAGTGLNGTWVNTTTRDLVAATMNRIAQKGLEGAKESPVESVDVHDGTPPVNTFPETSPESEQNPTATTPPSIVATATAQSQPSASPPVNDLDENREISSQDDGYEAERDYPGVVLGTPKPRPIGEEMQVKIEKAKARKQKTNRSIQSKYKPAASPAIKAVVTQMAVSATAGENDFEAEELGSAQAGLDMIKKTVRGGEPEPSIIDVDGNWRLAKAEEGKNLWGGRNKDFF